MLFGVDDDVVVVVDEVGVAEGVGGVGGPCVVPGFCKAARNKLGLLLLLLAALFVDDGVNRTENAGGDVDDDEDEDDEDDEVDDKGESMTKC